MFSIMAASGIHTRYNVCVFHIISFDLLTHLVSTEDIFGQDGSTGLLSLALVGTSLALTEDSFSHEIALLGIKL
jgi:hypothetical protein